MRGGCARRGKSGRAVGAWATPQRLEAVSRGIAGEEAELGGLVADVKEAAERARASAAARSDYEELGVERRRETCHHRHHPYH